MQLLDSKQTHSTYDSLKYVTNCTLDICIVCFLQGFKLPKEPTLVHAIYPLYTMLRSTRYTIASKEYSIQQYRRCLIHYIYR